MRFTVNWSPAAEQRLAELWLAARDRTALTEAAREMERVLSSDPQRAGESRSGRSRILIIPPLAALYEVDAVTQRVIVRRLQRW